MKTFKVQLTVAFLTVLTFLGAPTARAESVTWDILAWPEDQDWGGPHGNPAVVSENDVLLTGQDVLTKEAFSAPVTISYDALLVDRSTWNGGLTLFFVPEGQPSNVTPTNSVSVGMDFRTYTTDALFIYQYFGWHNATLFYEAPFTLTEGTNHHVIVNVAADGKLSWSIDGQNYALPETAKVPYDSFQLRLASWQPTAEWHVSNFSVSSLTNPTVCELQCPGNITVAAAPGATNALVSYPVPTVTGDCIAASISCSPASGSEFPLGVTPVQCTASNTVGETASCSFTVTVTATPVATCASIVDLRAKVQSLDLAAGLRNALSSKLDAAEASLNRGQNRACANQLKAFINQVRVLPRNGRLTEAAAEDLITCARALQPEVAKKKRR